MIPNLKNLSLIGIFAFFMFATKTVGAADYTILVNPGVGESSSSKAQIKQILLANQTTWKDGKKIVIVTLSPDATGADDVATEFMSMSAIQAKKYWLTKVFGGVLASAPASLDSVEEVVDKVASTPGTIAVIPKDSKLGKVKVLSLTP